ncbi:MAG: GNAT family N-acetyltransferase [bacterium]
MTLNIRSVENETELEKVFDLLHEVNPDTPRDYFSSIVRGQPNFERWHTRIASEHDKVVATIQVFDKKMWLNRKEVRFGGLGHLAVSPGYESKVNPAEITEDTLDLLQEFGYPLSVVFTNDNEFYSNLGFVAMPLLEYSFDQLAAYDTTGVRPFDGEKDLECVMEIYNEFNSGRNGPVCRTLADWQAQSQYNADDPKAFWVFEQDGRVYGYVRGRIREGVLEILEFGASKSYAAYFRRILTAMFDELDFHTAKITLRRDEPFFNASYISAHYTQDTRMMWSVLNEEKLADILGSEPDGVNNFMKQLRDFQTTFWRTDVF